MKNIYDLTAIVFYRVLTLRNFLYSKLFVKKLSNFKDIPIIINNRNRFTFLKKLVEKLQELGYNNIYILDNKSTYPPLLEYYKKINVKVYFLDRNYGFKALEESGLINKFKYNFFVYTDPDVIPIEECPSDFIEKFYNILIENSKIQKVGFSLKIDDLPNFFDKKQEVIQWEKELYKNELEDGVFIAPIDTTFALHRPLSRISTQGRYLHARTAYPYEARHMPWYNDSSKLDEEEKYYINSVEIGTHWSTGNGYENINILKRIIKKWL